MLSKTPALVWLFILTLMGPGKSVSAQQRVAIQLTVVSRPTYQSANSDVGLLIDVKNLTDQDIAIYTPVGSLVDHLKYYKLNPQTKQYQEIIHPLVQELQAQRAFRDSLFQAKQAIVDFFGITNYNTKSALYNEFIQSDSLYFDHITQSSTYENQITDAERLHFRTASGLTNHALFTLLKGHEHYQDFSNISFLYQAKGEYKIALNLPEIKLQKAVQLATTFAVTEIQHVYCNTIYLSVR